MILFSPHNDDETLFAAYTILRFRPKVITVLESQKQEIYGITAAQREKETAAALSELGNPLWEQWKGDVFRDMKPDWRTISTRIGWALRGHTDLVFAPAVEEGGHEDHNAIGAIVTKLVPKERRVMYCTYRRGETRSTGVEVEAMEGWRAAKLKAMSCYTSQIELDNTRPWFSGWDREWVR